jgi:hypothetical protein
MPANIICPPRNQDFLLPPSLKDWLPEDHLVWFSLEAVRSMDLLSFCANIRMDGSGGAAYDPAMMGWDKGPGLRFPRIDKLIRGPDAGTSLMAGQFHQESQSPFISRNVG